MFCRLCGKQVEGQEEFCESCKLSEKMTCCYCGKETSKQKRFCEHCGGYFKDSKVPQKKWQPPTPTNTANRVGMKYCQACGRSIPGSDFFCSICGKMADASVTHRKNVGSFWIGMLLVWGLGLIGLIVAYAIGKSETIRGAKVWFTIHIIVVALLVLVYVLLIKAIMENGGYY